MTKKKFFFLLLLSELKHLTCRKQNAKFINYSLSIFLRCYWCSIVYILIRGKFLFLGLVFFSFSFFVWWTSFVLRSFTAAGYMRSTNNFFLIEFQESSMLSSKSWLSLIHVEKQFIISINEYSILFLLFHLFSCMCWFNIGISICL